MANTNSCSSLTSAHFVKHAEGLLSSFRSYGNANKTKLTRMLFDSPLFSQAERVPGKYFVKASLFDKITSARTDIFLESQIHWEGDVGASIQ